MADKCLNSNPDIAGIGTRINFYVTILLTTLARGHEDTTELLDELYKSSVLYGLSLVMTAVIQTLQGQLDLYHAIFVMQITFSLNIVYTYGQRRFIQSSSRDFRMKIFITIQMFSTMIFTVWLLYVWVKDSDFGSQPECNHLVKYVLFFANVKATVTWLRVLFIIYLVLTACALLFTFAVILSVYLSPDIHKKLRSVVGPGHGQPEQESPPANRRTMRRYVSFSFVSAVYGVATLELIVRRNRPNIQPGEGVWGFGQIIALILILGSVIDVAVILHERRTRRPEETSS
ncbi:hypothetical protein BC826DRAFT_1108519 [Russula brevipes]|nr:hypothetical protein BC826DRAFT_1108519 [Russula brevipes]